MKILIIFISLALSYILYSQFQVINNFKNELEVYEIVNPDKKTFEDNVNMHNPCIFSNITDAFDSLQNYNIESLNKLDSKIRKELTNAIKGHFEYYLVPLLYKSKFDIVAEEADTTTELKRQLNYRLLICQIIGAKTVIMYPPKSAKYLYPDNDFIKSTIDIWDSNLDDIENIKNTEYLEITLYPGNMLYIPHNWWYATINNDDSYCVYQSCESIFSNFLKL